MAWNAEWKKSKIPGEHKTKKKRKNGLFAKIKKTPINYFSDLFVVSMVLAWIVTLIVMIGVAIYATVRFEDVTIWENIESLVAIPLSTGGAIWMIKNSVQHAIASNRGKKCPSDFPEVEDAEITKESEEEE